METLEKVIAKITVNGKNVTARVALSLPIVVCRQRGGGK